MTTWTDLTAETRQELIKGFIADIEQRLARYGMDPDGVLIAVNEGPLTVFASSDTDASVKSIVAALVEKTGRAAPCKRRS